MAFVLLVVDRALAAEVFHISCNSMHYSSTPVFLPIDIEEVFHHNLAGAFLLKAFVLAGLGLFLERIVAAMAVSTLLVCQTAQSPAILSAVPSGFAFA